MADSQTKIKLSLTYENFQDLVQGRVVKHASEAGDVEVILQDIGFERMNYAVQVAQQSDTGPLFKEDTNNKTVRCMCGQTTSISRLQGLKLIDGNSVQCPSCGRKGSL